MSAIAQSQSASCAFDAKCSWCHGRNDDDEDNDDEDEGEEAAAAAVVAVATNVSTGTKPTAPLAP